MKATVADVLAVLEAFAPCAWAGDVCPGDNVGLLVGRRDAEVSRVLVTLDIGVAALREAAALGAQLLVAHHPVTFGMNRVTGDTAEGAILLRLIERGMAAVCMHTNWDAAPGGINDLLAEALGLKPPYEILGPAFTHPGGRVYGLGRVGVLPEPMAPEAFAARVKMSLGCVGVRIWAGTRPCRHVAVGCGSSGSQWNDVLRLGCDTFVTGDVKHHLWPAAAERDITLIDAGHFPTENIIVAPMAERLRRALPGVEVFASEADREPAAWL